MLDRGDGDRAHAHSFRLFRYDPFEFLDGIRILLVLQLVLGLDEGLVASGDDFGLDHDSPSCISDFTLNLDLLALDCYLSRLDLVFIILLDCNMLLDGLGLHLLSLDDLFDVADISSDIHLTDGLL